MIGLVIDPGSDSPPFEQLRLQILNAVRSGELAPGTKLPTVRSLAGELGIAPNTVARSYRELERDELIETRGRNGTYVATSGDTRLAQGQLAALDFAARIRQLDLSDAEALDLVRSALRARE